MEENDFQIDLDIAQSWLTARQMMSTIHLVYPHGQRISCPDAIGRNLGKRLLASYPVVFHDWASHELIFPRDGDILIGHPHPYANTCMRRSLSLPGWKRIILLGPFNYADPTHNAYYDSFIQKSNLYLAIAGKYWFQGLSTSLFSHWAPKMYPLDLAVDRQDFPIIKKKFNLPGKRRWLYIGHSGWTNNVKYLSQISSLTPDNPIAWIGQGKHIDGCQALGYQDFSQPKSRDLLQSFDFMITVSKADSNPTTILEAMAWGLIPVCTPQSGYVGYPGIVNIPLGDLEGAGEIINQMQTKSNVELEEMQHQNWQLLDAYFNWDRFTLQVIEAIQSDENPDLFNESLRRKLAMRWYSWISPYNRYSPQHAVEYAKHLFLNKVLKQ